MANITLVVKIMIDSENIQEFIKATKKAQEASLQEKGCVRYDILQDATEKDHFILVEEYTDEEAINSHKESNHFKEWKEVVNPFGTRRSAKYTSL